MTSRLRTAVQQGLVEPLSEFGFMASGGGGVRGETVDCSNGVTVITVTADWLEGELSITVHSVGEQPQPIEQVVDVGSVRGLHLSRLGRNVTTATLAANLKRIAVALTEQAPEVLRPPN